MVASLIFVFAVLPLTFLTVGAENITSSFHDHEAQYCLVPPHPEYGKYSVSNHPSAMPGERYSSVKLVISCNTGYLSNNTINSVFCINGDWSAPMPTCVHDLLGYCTLSTDDVKVAYYCLSFVGTHKRSRECASLVPSGTIVRPLCKFPSYFSRSVLPEMHCRNGTWDYQPICEPACGLTTEQQLDGTSTNHLELPWHAVIHIKDYPLRYYGSLITETKIISAANCFYEIKNKLRPVSDFMVAVDKMHSSINDTHDRNRQLSEVIDIKVPSSYRGYAMFLEDDIAIVIVKTPFFFHLSVRPVCLDFDNNLDSTQLIEGNSGKTVAWRDANGQSDVLYVTDIPYLNDEDCLNLLTTFRAAYLTKDKFCARYDGRWSDAPKTGSGLVVFNSTTQRYYLRGVQSDLYVGPGGRISTWIVLYTSITKHKDFIKQHL